MTPILADTISACFPAALPALSWDGVQAHGRLMELAAVANERALVLGLIRPDPISCQGFLPVSAAGILQSDLDDDCRQEFTASPDQRRFETDLGAQVLNEFDHYAGIEAASRRACLAAFV